MTVTVHESSLIEMAATLERHPDFRVLRRLIFRDELIPANDQPAKTAIVLEGRNFEKSNRCLIPASAFFEFAGKKYPKAKHRFTLNGEPFMAIAGIWREGLTENYITY